MSSHSQDALHLFDTETFEKVATVQTQGLDVIFPEFVRGWSDVLDSRIAPYTEQSIEEICNFAHHVHKKFILVTDAQASKNKLPSSD